MQAAQAELAEESYGPLLSVKVEEDAEGAGADNAAAAAEEDEVPGLTAQIEATEASIKELTTSIDTGSAKLEAHKEAHLAGSSSTERGVEIPPEDKVLHLRRVLQHVEEELSGGTAKALGEALQKVDELDLAGMMGELHAEQRRRARKELAGKGLAETQKRLEEAEAGKDYAAIPRACDDLEAAIAACESTGMHDGLEDQRGMLARARALRRDRARSRLGAASAEGLGEEGRRQGLQEALGAAEEAGLQQGELRMARQSLKQEEALADLRRLVSYHSEHEVDDDASTREFCAAIKRAVSLGTLLRPAVQEATPVYKRLEKRSWERGRKAALELTKAEVAKRKAAEADAAALKAKAATPSMVAQSKATMAAPPPAKANAASPPAKAAAPVGAAAAAKAPAKANAAAPTANPAAAGARAAHLAKKAALAKAVASPQRQGLRAKAASLAAAFAGPPASGAAGGPPPSPQRPFSAFGRPKKRSYSVLPLRRRAADGPLLSAAQPKKRPLPVTPPWRDADEAADGARKFVRRGSRCGVRRAATDDAAAAAAARAPAAAPRKGVPWRPVGDAAANAPPPPPPPPVGARPWRPAEEAAGASGGAPPPQHGGPRAPRTPRRRRPGQDSSEDGVASLPAGVPAGSIFWKSIEGVPALVINADTFPRTMLEMGMNAGRSAVEHFNWNMYDDWKDHWMQCSEKAGAGYLYWDAPVPDVDGCSTRACAYGEPQKTRTMRALGLALAVACAVQCGKPGRYGDCAFPARQWEQLVKAATDMVDVEE